MRSNTESSPISREHEKKSIMDAKLNEYFEQNPEALPWKDEIYVNMNGQTPVVDDLILPKEIANIIRARDGRELLHIP